MAGRSSKALPTSVLIAVGLAGSLGALSRYAIARLVASPPGRFPTGTFVINITGSFAIGIVLGVLAQRFVATTLARPLIATGFLGGYTTFSTFMVDADLLFRGHYIRTGIEYVSASLLGGVVAAFLGMAVANACLGLLEMRAARSAAPGLCLGDDMEPGTKGANLTSAEEGDEAIQRMTVVFNAHDHVRHGALAIEALDAAKHAGLAGATLFEALEGGEGSGALSTRHLLSDRSPLCLVIVERKSKLREFLEGAGDLFAGELVILEDVKAYRA